MSEKPKKEYRAGSVRATIWENDRADKDGQKFTVASVQIERRYPDQDGNWQSTNSFRKADLPLVQVVTAKAFEYLTVSERDPDGQEVPAK